jgi:DNA-binding transcriptional MerR regulator
MNPMNTRNIIETFTEERASRLTGVSIRQLRYWDRDGFFSPSLGYEDRSAPYSRLYSFRDIVSLKVLNTLRNDASVPLQHLREVKAALLSLGEPLWADTILYVHNKRVVFFNPTTEILEEVVSGQALLQIPLRVASANMREAIDRMNQRQEIHIGKFERKRNVANNQLVIAGTRIPVANIKAFSDAGYSVEQIKAEYPTLAEADILAAVAAKAA